MENLTKKTLKEQYKNRTLIGGIYCIKCNGNHAQWLRSTTNMQGSKNRFQFSVSTNSCPELCMHDAWKQFGATSFSFEILEEIKKKETQSEQEFKDDINTLMELWKEK
jgi:hypothetical protein